MTLLLKDSSSLKIGKTRQRSDCNRGGGGIPDLWTLEKNSEYFFQISSTVMHATSVDCSGAMTTNLTVLYPLQTKCYVDSKTNGVELKGNGLKQFFAHMMSKDSLLLLFTK